MEFYLVINLGLTDCKKKKKKYLFCKKKNKEKKPDLFCGLMPISTATKTFHFQNVKVSKYDFSNPDVSNLSLR